MLLSDARLDIPVFQRKQTLESVLQKQKREMGECLIPICPPAKHVRGVFMDVAYDFTEPETEHYGMQIHLHFAMGRGPEALHTWRVEAPEKGTHNYWHVQQNADRAGSRRMDTETGHRYPSSYPAFPLDARCAFEAFTCSLVAIIGLNEYLRKTLCRAEQQAKGPGTLHQYYLAPD